MPDLLFAVFGLTCVIIVPVGILAIVALVRTFRIEELQRQISQLQAEVARRTAPPLSPETAGEAPREAAVAAEAIAEAPVLPPAASAAPFPAIIAPPPTAAAGAGLEMLIGRKVLGWVAGVLLIFGTAFFLKYAYDNGWIGPLGQVSLGLLAGLALVMAGRHYQRRGWRIFSQMMTGAGVVLLYLSTYSAFGFYRLLPQQAAGAILLVIVVESALLALCYEAPALGLVAVLGGLLTPILMHSERDEYQALFTYLALLDTGVVLLLTVRNWAATGTVALLGSQGLYWLWHNENYHPEKFVWALGFQAAVFALFLGHAVAVHILRGRRTGVEDLVRMLLGAGLWFGTAYVLLDPDYGVWMGSLALAMAALYATLAWLALARPANDTGLVVTLLAISMGYIAMALPIEAAARFVALGWAAQAAALWWFGLRIRAWPLRTMAAVLGMLAVARVVLVDTPHYIREPFVPVFNRYALPSVGVAAGVIGSVLVGRRYIERLGPTERVLLNIAGVTGVVLLWWILSVDTSGCFEARGALPESDATRWRWAGQMALSALWALYASVLLTLGFRLGRPQLRWLALVLYAVTVGKVFLVDMDQLRDFYRILAFFISAVLLGAAAWAYQRFHFALTAAAGGEKS